MRAAGGSPCDVAVLIETHRAAIDALREAVADVKPDADDLALLRYVLSFPEPEEASAALRFATEWRRDPVNSLYLELADVQEKAKAAEVAKGTAINIASYHAGLKESGLLHIVRPNLIDFTPVLAHQSHEQQVYFHVVQKEIAYRRIDALTRSTGLLSKVVVINDFIAMRMFNVPPLKVMQAFGESSRLAEKLYPQMLDRTIFCNCPWWFKTVVKMAKSVLPARLFSKFYVCPGPSKGAPSIDSCPYVRDHLNVAQVPSFLGGTCRCPGGCVESLDNDMTEPHVLTPEEIADLVEIMRGFLSPAEQKRAARADE